MLVLHVLLRLEVVYGATCRPHAVFLQREAMVVCFLFFFFKYKPQ